VKRVRAWMEERDNEGTTLLVVEKSTGQAIGLMILFGTDTDSIPGGIEVRIGYLSSEPAWGQGYATELIRGSVGWCRGYTKIRSLVGDVERSNAASARVLEKSGFQSVQEYAEIGHQEQIFRLTLWS